MDHLKTTLRRSTLSFLLCHPKPHGTSEEYSCEKANGWTTSSLDIEMKCVEMSKLTPCNLGFSSGKKGDDWWFVSEGGRVQRIQGF